MIVSTLLQLETGLDLGNTSKTKVALRPWLILLKLNHAMDVATILSNRSFIDGNSIIIKPDMTPQNQHKEALLLKERWALIKSAVDKVDIKIKSSSLYVKGTNHGYVLNSVFNPTSGSPSILTMDTNSTNQNIPPDSNTSNLQSNSKTIPQTKSQDWLGSSSNVSPFYCNARSLCNKLYKFQGYIYASSFDICVTETWLNSDIVDNEVLPKGYSIYQRD